MNNSTSKQRTTTRTSVLSANSVPFMHPVGNETPHNFANRGREFLTAAKVQNEYGGKNMPNDPTYLLTFLALELCLKAYLLGNGATLQYVSGRIGHSIQRAMKEAKKKGLKLEVDPKFQQNVMQFSEAYNRRDFQYRSNRQGLIILPGDLIEYVDIVRSACGC